MAVRPLLLTLLLVLGAARAPAAPTGVLLARDIVVLTGIAEISGEEQWPADTAAAKRFQMALEYMGYELHFRRATDLAEDGFLKLRLLRWLASSSRGTSACRSETERRSSIGSLQRSRRARKS